MQIRIAKKAGFCFGVKRALQIAYKAARSHKNIFMLGDIVHNETVVKDMEKIGIKKIKTLAKVKNAVLLIRAHGAGCNTVKKARRMGYKIIDATCPMVKEIHRLAKNAQKLKQRLIVIGDKNHDEVKGIIGQVRNKAIVINGCNNIPFGKLKGIKKAAVVAQSTQDIAKVMEIVAIIKKIIPKIIFFNTICRPTREKQEEIRNMPARNEAMIIIGSKASANTKRLFEISKSLNNKSYWIQSKKELKPQWFKNIATVGIAAGASTPRKTIKEITKAINLSGLIKLKSCLKTRKGHKYA
jgi:4-hydroxy-3-methylbut-2-enyl diphosphate reductase